MDFFYEIKKPSLITDYKVVKIQKVFYFDFYNLNKLN